MTEECQCPDARKWRAYWSREAIAERLNDEVALYRGIVQDALFWGTSYRGPIPPRVDCSMSNVELPDSFAALERRRRGG